MTVKGFILLLIVIGTFMFCYTVVILWLGASQVEPDIITKRYEVIKEVAIDCPMCPDCTAYRVDCPGIDQERLKKLELYEMKEIVEKQIKDVQGAIDKIVD